MRFYAAFAALVLLGWVSAWVFAYDSGDASGAGTTAVLAHHLRPLDSGDAYVFAQQRLLRAGLGAMGYVFVGGSDFVDETRGRYWRVHYAVTHGNRRVQRELGLCANVWQTAERYVGQEPGVNWIAERYADGFYRVIHLGALQRCKSWQPLSNDPSLNFAS